MHGSLFKHLFMFEILLVCTMRKMDWGIGYFVVKGINSLVFSWATLGFFLCISFFASLCFLRPSYFSFIYIILYFCFFLDLRKIVLLHRKKWIKTMAVMHLKCESLDSCAFHLSLSFICTMFWILLVFLALQLFIQLLFSRISLTCTQLFFILQDCLYY